jgi:hypothetical protein
MKTQSSTFYYWYLAFGMEKSTNFAAGFGFFQPKINRESCENQELCP